MKKVLCCIPTLGNIRIELAQRLYQWKAQYGDFFDIYSVIGKPLLEARNECVESFLNMGASYLLFVDSDILPPPNAIDILLSHGFDKKIVGGLCPIIKQDIDGVFKKIYLALEEVAHGEYKIIDENLQKGVIEVDATGAACLMIHKSVFKKMQNPWFETNAEDFYFCEKAKDAGFPIYIDCDCKVVHYKVVGL